MLSMSNKKGKEDNSEERKKKIAFLQDLKRIRGYWFNIILKYNLKIKILEMRHVKWYNDDKKFYKEIQWYESVRDLKTFPDVPSITWDYLFVSNARAK